MQFVRKVFRKLKKIPDMKKEKVYNEAVNGDEGFAPGNVDPACEGASCANVADDAAEEPAKMAEAEEAPADGLRTAEESEATARAVEEAGKSEASGLRKTRNLLNSSAHKTTSS